MVACVPFSSISRYCGNEGTGVYWASNSIETSVWTRSNSATSPFSSWHVVQFDSACQYYRQLGPQPTGNHKNKEDRMTTLVIGSGLIGSQVARILVERGEKPVLMDYAAQRQAIGQIVELAKVTLVVGDVL